MSYFFSAELSIKNYNETQVELIVKYNLAEESLSPQQYKEEISVIGDDPGMKNDIEIFIFPTQRFQSKPAKLSNNPAEPDIIAGNNPRIRKQVLNKSQLNEDTGLSANGQEFKDEIKTKILLTTINPLDSTPATISTFTNTVRRAF